MADEKKLKLLIYCCTFSDRITQNNPLRDTTKQSMKYIPNRFFQKRQTRSRRFNRDAHSNKVRGSFAPIGLIGVTIIAVGLYEHINLIGINDQIKQEEMMETRKNKLIKKKNDNLVLKRRLVETINKKGQNGAKTNIEILSFLMLNKMLVEKQGDAKTKEFFTNVLLDCYKTSILQYDEYLNYILTKDERNELQHSINESQRGYLYNFSKKSYLMSKLEKHHQPLIDICYAGSIARELMRHYSVYKYSNCSNKSTVIGTSFDILCANNELLLSTTTKLFDDVHSFFNYVDGNVILNTKAQKINIPHDSKE